VRKWWIISPLAAIALWQILVSAGALGKTPSPVSVVRGLYQLTVTGFPPGYRLFGHLAASLERVLIGFALAFVIAVPLGILMGSSELLEGVLDPLVEAVRPVPPLAWLPLAIIWFGIGKLSAAFLIFLGAFFPIVLNTVSGVKSVDPHLVEAARTLGAKRGAILARVLAPGSLPSVITGLRVGIGIGWMTLVAAELTGVSNGYGLGYMILTASEAARYDYVVAGMVVIGLIGYLMDRTIRLVSKRLLRWR
jgi:ABC-type nitrate/sulfonate/bicarbonate transport system permease component